MTRRFLALLIAAALGIAGCERAETPFTTGAG